MSKKLFLAGGGTEKSSRAVDSEFASLVIDNKSVVYIPNAADKKQYSRYLKWFRKTMSPLGISKIEVWDDLKPRLPISKLGGIYLGGGNTPKLLKELNESAFDSFLSRAILRGVPVYGGSAGAIVLGLDIRTAPEAIGIKKKNARGLNMVGLYSVACHYTLEKEEQIRQIGKAIGTRIIAIPETAGVRILGSKATVFGKGIVAVFSKSHILKLKKGEEFILEK